MSKVLAQMMHGDDAKDMEDIWSAHFEPVSYRRKVRRCN